MNTAAAVSLKGWKRSRVAGVRRLAVFVSALVVCTSMSFYPGHASASGINAITSGVTPNLASSPEGSLADTGRLVARSVKGGGAVVSSDVGSFVTSSAGGVVRLIDSTGAELARFVPAIVVDGVSRPLRAVVSAGGHVVSFTASSAIRIGANIAAVAIEQTGNALQRCVDSGLAPAVTAAVVGAITAGVAGFFVGGLGAIPGAVGGAIVAGFSTFTAACLTAAAAGVVQDTLDGTLPGQIVAIPFS